MKKSGLNFTAFLASGVVITAGFFGGLIVIVAFASPDHINKYIGLLTGIYLAILLIPLNALRSPKTPEEKARLKQNRFFRFKQWMARRRKKSDSNRTEWKRKTGQRSHTVPGQRESRPSTFVRTPRKRSGA